MDVAYLEKLSVGSEQCGEQLRTPNAERKSGEGSKRAKCDALMRRLGCCG